MIKRLLTAFAVTAAITLANSAAWSEPKDIRWGTPPGRHRRPQGAGHAGQPAEQGDAGVPHLGAADRRRHRHRQGLSPPRSSTPTMAPTSPPRARDRLRPLQGLQGARPAHADAVVLVEHDRSRPRDPRRNKDKIKKWGDLAGKRVFTGPLPFDTRAQSRARPWRRSASSSPTCRWISRPPARSSNPARSTRMTIYTGSGSSPPPWLAEASLAADWAVLNPSPEEIAELEEEGLRRSPR